LAVIFGLLSVWYAKKEYFGFQQDWLAHLCLFIVEMDFVGRYDDQRILFCMSIYGTHWTRKKGDAIEFQFQNFQRRKKMQFFYILR
jgi:hypothetical protein